MDDIERIKESVDIIDFIRGYVTLKKSGSNFKALCPFHAEKTPSFFVSPDKQVWHCFGCGKGGDLFSFVMEIERMDFPEALKMLAKKAGITLRRSYEITKKQKVREKIYVINSTLIKFYEYMLHKHRFGQKALEYLKDRGLNIKLIKKFQIGYAPDSWDSQLKFLAQKGFSRKDMKLAGVVVRGQKGNFYDRFRGRIIFPLKDHRDFPIGFSGRVLIEKERKGGKYINIPETVVYKKGTVLYGLNFTKDEIKKKDSVIVVEGEFDFLSAYQAGTKNIIAIKGTALTRSQLRLLKRYTNTIILALDSDIAGDKASQRSIRLADEMDMRLKVVDLPIGKDPDDCIRKNRILWVKAVKKALPLYDYLIFSSMKRYNIKTAEGKKQASEDIIPFLADISNPIVQGHYIRKMAEIFELSEETVVLAINRYLRIGRKIAQEDVFVSDRPSKKREEFLQDTILAFIFQTESKKILEFLLRNLTDEEFLFPSYKELFLVALKHKGNSLPLSKSNLTVPKKLEEVYNRLILFPVLEQFKNELEQSNYLVRVVKEIKSFSLKMKIKKLATKIKEFKEEINEEENEHLKNLDKEIAFLTIQLKEVQKIKIEL